MPYQSVLEEQLKKGEYLSIGWPWRLFVFTLIIFFLLVFIYFGVTLGLKPYLKSQIRNSEQKISDLNQSVDESQQKQLLGFYSQLVNIKDIINSRKTISQIFDFIEKNTYQTVGYNILNFNLADREAKIGGLAPDYETLTKEIALFEKSESVEKVMLENSSIGESIKSKADGVRFTLRLIFKPGFFNQ